MKTFILLLLLVPSLLCAMPEKFYESAAVVWFDENGCMYVEINGHLFEIFHYEHSIHCKKCNFPKFWEEMYNIPVQ